MTNLLTIMKLKNNNINKYYYDNNWIRLNEFGNIMVTDIKTSIGDAKKVGKHRRL